MRNIAQYERNQDHHSWYCGIALLLAPTIAALFPLFQETFMNGKQWFSWATLPVLYPQGVETISQLYETAGLTATTVTPEIVGTTVDPSVVAANPSMMIFISALALITNAMARADVS